MWDAETGEVVEREVRTTVGRLIFNQILPERLRFSNRPMNRAALREVVSDCYRLLGSVETAHLVDGIKSVGFKYATRGGMTIAVSDIPVSRRQGRAAGRGRRPGRHHRPAVPARPHHGGRAVREGRGGLEGHHGQGGRGDARPTAPRGPGRDAAVIADLRRHDDRLRCPREQGQHRSARRHARPDDRPDRPDHRRPGALELPRGHDRPRVLHLHPRRPQGPRGHRAPHRRLGLPDPAAGGRGAGRHHP